MQFNKQTQVSIFSSLKKFSIKNWLKLSIKFWPWQVKILQESGSWLPKTNCQVSALTSRETNYDITELAAFGNGHDAKLSSRTMLCIWWNHFFSHSKNKKEEFSFLMLQVAHVKHLEHHHFSLRQGNKKELHLPPGISATLLQEQNSSFWF